MVRENATTPVHKTQSESLGTLVLRATKLRCPACGQGKLFRGLLTMNDPCKECGRKFEREPGYLLGSIYVNYAVTALLVLIMYFALFLGTDLTNEQRLVVTASFSLLFPLGFFRFARAYWVAMDEKFDPWPNETEAREMAAKITKTK